MQNKFNMAKDDNIYKSARLVGIKITLADTYSFMNNVNIGKISIDDILNLRD